MKLQGSFTKRALIAGLIAGSGILAASSFAMPGAGSAGKDGCEARHGQKVHAGMEARRAEHLSGLKEKLKLKPEQEAAWNAFSSASQSGMRPMGGDRQAVQGELDKLSTPQRLDRIQAMSDVRRARLAERAEAIKAFYAQLTPEQQGVFDAEAMPGRFRGHHPHRFQS
jgi:Spy/CpxP family protein refolding chaperone